MGESGLKHTHEEMEMGRSRGSGLGNEIGVDLTLACLSKAAEVKTHCGSQYFYPTDCNQKNLRHICNGISLWCTCYLMSTPSASLCA